MALAKDHTPLCSFYGNILEAGSSMQFPQIFPYGLDDYNQKQDGDGLENPNNSNNRVISTNQVMSHSSSPPLSSSSSANSNNGYPIQQPSNYQPHEEVHSLINFKTNYGGFMHNSGSLLSFQQEDNHANHVYQKLTNNPNHDHHYPTWEGSGNQFKQMKNNTANLRLLDEVNCLPTVSNGYEDEANEWLYVEATIAHETPEGSGTQQTCFNKRPYVEEENMKAPKKQCTSNSGSKKPAKPNKSSTSKDPQSIAAKNRRERISERLKILQDLVPNGSKVDLVTMLEKAIGYVKFLQLQVKVLAEDEFWPAAGGKAPDISQVREAIDAILSSQRSERTTSSSSK